MEVPNKYSWSYQLSLAGRVSQQSNFRNYKRSAWNDSREFACYSIIVVLALVGIARSRIYFFVVGIVAPLSILAILASLYPSHFAQNSEVISPTNIDLVLCFLAGVAIYKYREMIPHSAAIAFLAAAGYVALMNTQCGHLFTSLLIAYVTIWIGVTNYRKIFLIKGGDYSYGIYLYHFTLQQAIVSLGILAWYSVFASSLIIATAIAALSWNLVEKPALSLRVYLRRPNPREASTTAFPIQDAFLSPNPSR